MSFMFMTVCFFSYKSIILLFNVQMSFHTYLKFKVFFTWTPFNTVMIFTIVKTQNMRLIGHSGQWPEFLEPIKKFK